MRSFLGFWELLLPLHSKVCRHCSTTKLSYWKQCDLQVGCRATNSLQTATTGHDLSSTSRLPKAKWPVYTNNWRFWGRTRSCIIDAKGTTKEFASRVFSPAVTKYSTTLTEKECLAIVWEIRKFCNYLIGAMFTLIIDHQPLKWLGSARKNCANSQCLEHWALELCAYEFDTIYHPDAQNQVTDALSHCPVNLVTLNSPVSKVDFSETQKTHPVLKSVIDHLSLTGMPLTSGNWRTFSWKHLKHLWHQLCIYDFLLCRKVKLLHW